MSRGNHEKTFWGSLAFSILLVLGGCNSAEEFKALNPTSQNDSRSEQVNDLDDPTGNEGGEGGSGGPQYLMVTDRFEQTAERRDKPVDILFVVDNSGSMGDDQQNLAANIDVFINQFLQEDLNFHLAVTTTDPRAHVADGDGKLRFDRVFTRQEFDQNLQANIDQLRSALMAGVHGSGTETPLNNTMRAIQRDQAQQNRLFRGAANSVVIAISDEHDSSLARTGLSVSDYVQWFQQNEEQRFTFFAIGRETAGSGAHAGASMEIAEAAVLTGGSFSSIFGHWAQNLQGIGETIVILASSFPLTKSVADATMIEVKVDGQVVSDVRYDDINNAIIFEVEPVEGAQIEITYPTESGGSTSLASN